MESKFLNKAAEVRRWANGVLVDIKRPEYSTYRMASGAGLNRVLQTLDVDTDFLLITAFRSHDKSTPPRLRSKQQNEKLFREIPKKLRAMLGTARIGAYWLVGHWTDCTVDLKGKSMTECESLGGEFFDSLEYSWMFQKSDPKISGDTWLKTAVALATEFEQDAFIIRLDSETTLRTQTGTVDKTLTSVGAVTNAWASLAKMRSGNEGFGYTELRKIRERGRIQPIVFPEVKGEPEATEEMGLPVKAASYLVNGDGTPHPIQFFVAQPHCNSSSMIFASLGVSYQIP